MTALNTPIVFSSTSGSDSQMSGSPSTRLIPSTLTLQITSGSNVAYGSASGAINPGDLVYAPNQTSGRKFNVVASINTSTFPTEYTFDNNWDASDFSATCYSGGKRATFDNADSRRLFDADSATGFVIETETDQSITSVVNITNGNITVRGDSGTQRTVTQTIDAACFNSAGNNFEYLKIQNTNTSKTNAFGVLPTANYVRPRFFRCVLGDSANKLKSAITRGSYLYIRPLFTECLITDCTSDGIGDMRDSYPVLSSSMVANNGDSGIYSPTRGDLTAVSTVFSGNTNDGIEGGHTGTNVNATNCVFYGNGRDGINSQYVSGINAHNIFVSNGRYGIHGYYAVNKCFENVFLNNATADVYTTVGSTGSADDSQVGKITLQANPFVDPTASPPDFNLNNALGGGSVLRSTKYTLGG